MFGGFVNNAFAQKRHGSYHEGHRQAVNGAEKREPNARFM